MPAPISKPYIRSWTQLTSDSIGVPNGIGGTGGLVFGSVGLVEANRSYDGFQDHEPAIQNHGAWVGEAVRFRGRVILRARHPGAQSAADSLASVRPSPRAPGTSRTYSVFSSVTYDLNEQLRRGSGRTLAEGRCAGFHRGIRTADTAPKCRVWARTRMWMRSEFDTASFESVFATIHRGLTSPIRTCHASTA